MIEEAKKQIELGKDRAAFDLGVFLEELKDNLKLNIPQEALDKLFRIVEMQAKGKIHKK